MIIVNTAKSSTLSGVEKTRILGWANIVIPKFFDEQNKRRIDTKLKTLTPEKNSKITGLATNPNRLFNDNKNSSGGGVSSLSIMGGWLATKMANLLGKLIPKSIRSIPTKLKAFKTRTLKRITPRPIRQFLAKSTSTIRNIKRSFGKSTPRKLIPTMKSGIKSITSKAVSPLGKILSPISNNTSSFIQNVGKSSKKIGGKLYQITKSVGKRFGDVSVESAKKIVNASASKVISSSGGMTKLMTKLTTKVPVIGGLIEAAMATYDIKGMKNKLSKGEITMDQLQHDAGKRVITGVSGMIGSVGGAVLAGALGSIIPVAGTTLGAVVGAIGGDLAGRFFGGLISDYILPEKYTKTVGAFVTGTPPPKDEMQDFIIKDGKVHKFSNKDELMGLKSGGAINEFLQSRPKNDSYIRLVEIGLTANSYLMAIANNTAILAKGDKSNSAASPIIVQAPNTTSRASNKSSYINIYDNRSGYATSPYSLG